MGANWICSRRGIASTSRRIRRTATPNGGLSKKYAPHAMGIGISRVVAAGLFPPPSSGRRTPKIFCRSAPIVDMRHSPCSATPVGGAAPRTGFEGGRQELLGGGGTHSLTLGVVVRSSSSTSWA
jgi:hypothetical protein